MKKSSILGQLKNFSIGPLVGMVISMITVPITTRMLLPAEFGKSSLFTLTENIFLLIALLGLDQSFVRFFNEHTEDRNNLLFHAALFPLIICLFTIAVIMIAGPQISNAIFGSWEPFLLFLMCLYIPVIVLNRYATLILRMELRGKAYSFISIFSKCLYFSLLLVFLLFYQKTFRSIVLATVASTYLVTIVALFFTKRSWSFKNVKYDKALIKALLAYSLPLIPANILSWVFNSFDKVALRALSTFEELGIYSAGFKIVALMNIVSSIFNTAWVPIAYEWHSKNTRYEEYDRVGTYLLATFSTLFSLIVIFRGILLMALGPNYRNTESVIVLLLFMPIMQTISETTTLGIAFSKKTIYNLLISGITSVINLVGNYLLIPSLGAKGAALTTCGSYIVFFWLRTLISRKLWYKFNLTKYIAVLSIMLIFPAVILFSLPKYIEIIAFLALSTVNILLAIRAKKTKES